MIDYENVLPKDYNVSRETLLKLTQYIELLLKWNQKINLISRKGNHKNLIKTHIEDSISLIKHIANKQINIFDIGSGGGFPGIILSIFDYDITLIEKNHRKVIFLSEVIRVLNLNAKIIHIDARELTNKNADIITSKAVAKINNIISWTTSLASEKTRYLFLKNQTQINEMDEVKNYYSFKLQVHTNQYNNKIILELNNIHAL